MKEVMAARIALMLLSEALAGDEEAQGHIAALGVRLEGRAQEATTVIDAEGNITIGLRPVQATASLAAMR